VLVGGEQAGGAEHRLAVADVHPALLTLGAGPGELVLVDGNDADLFARVGLAERDRLPFDDGEWQPGAVANTVAPSPPAMTRVASAGMRSASMSATRRSTAGLLAHRASEPGVPALSAERSSASSETASEPGARLEVSSLFRFAELVFIIRMVPEGLRVWEAAVPC
jgi:hypothetical protein